MLLRIRVGRELTKFPTWGAQWVRFSIADWPWASRQIQNNMKLTNGCAYTLNINTRALQHWVTEELSFWNCGPTSKNSGKDTCECPANDYCHKPVAHSSEDLRDTENSSIHKQNRHLEGCHVSDPENVISHECLSKISLYQLWKWTEKYNLL